MKKSMNSTEGEAALSNMTLTVYLDKSKLSFLTLQQNSAPHLHRAALIFQLSESSLAEYAPMYEELQLCNLRKFFFTSHIYRQVVVTGLETICFLFVSISSCIKTNLFSFLHAGLHLAFSHQHKTAERTKSLNCSLIEYHHNWRR